MTRRRRPPISSTLSDPLPILFFGVLICLNVAWLLHSAIDSTDCAGQSLLLDASSIRPSISPQAEWTGMDNDKVLEEPQEPLEGVSACLCVMDDNHFLIEWLAYHYHTTNLRHLIITTDPNSATKPTSVLDRWRDRIVIEEWEDAQFIPKNFNALVEQRAVHHGMNKSLDLENHRLRQARFNMACLRTLKRQNRGWVLMLDTDEYLSVDPALRNPDFDGFDPKLKLLPIEAPGSIASYLQQLILPSAYYEDIKTPCVPVFRRQFAAKESDIEVVESMTPDGFNASNFQTMRWRRYGYRTEKLEMKWGGVCKSYRAVPNKVVIDLGRLRFQDLKHKENKGNPHNPLASICPSEVYLNREETPLRANHYLGTPEQWNYRTGDKRGQGFRIARYEDLNTRMGVFEADSVRPWLRGFVDTVGESEAERLLKGVGELEPLPDEALQTEAPPESYPQSSNVQFKVGDVVQANYKGDGYWAWGQVTTVFSNGFVNIMYTDCTEEVATFSGRLRRTGEVDEDVDPEFAHIDFETLALTGQLQNLTTM